MQSLITLAVAIRPSVMCLDRSAGAGVSWARLVKRVYGVFLFVCTMDADVLPLMHGY